MTVEKYFMIKFPQKYVAGPPGVELTTFWSPVTLSEYMEEQEEEREEEEEEVSVYTEEEYSLNPKSSVCCSNIFLFRVLSILLLLFLSPGHLGV